MVLANPTIGVESVAISNVAGFALNFVCVVCKLRSSGTWGVVLSLFGSGRNPEPCNPVSCAKNWPKGLSTYAL